MVGAIGDGYLIDDPREMDATVFLIALSHAPDSSDPIVNLNAAIAIAVLLRIDLIGS
jgi:hypothetical protein